MINGAHVIVYSQDAEADRRFLGEVLGFDSVDAGGGWLLFKAPPAEIAVHPTDGAGSHELYLMCDDVVATVADLVGKGVEVDATVSDRGWGLMSTITLPGGGRLGLYQPRHPTAFDL
jgi:catechol 2,3-dioxygenase-like lactoylglutathione lyase family enzyme